MTASDIPPQAGEPAASPFSGAPIAFVPAIIAGMVAGTLVLWVVATHSAASPPDPLRAHLVPWARPMAHSDERDQFLYHAGITLTALGGVVGAWVYARFARSTASVSRAPRPAQPRDRTPSRAGRSAGAKGTTVAAPESRSPGVRTPWANALLHALVVVAVGSLLYVPDYRSMAGTFLNLERFHHWHFFAVMPTHAYLQGLVPVLESYSQYGVGLPVIMGNLCRLTGDFSHASVVWLGMTYGVLYFIALYALLWAWLQDGWWSVGALSLGLLLQQFCGVIAPEVLWQYPSSTILRSPFDVWVFLLLTGHLYRGRWAYLVVAAVVVGLASFWESDTGLYLAGGYVAYCVYCWIDDVRTHGWDWVAACRYLTTGAIAPIVFLLLTWLSVGGAIFTALFWIRFLEPLRLFRSGFGMLPMPAPQWGNLYIFLTPGLYVLAAVLALVAALRLSTQPWRGGYLLGALGVYGAGIYHQYVGRSHPWNWFHVCLPFVVLGIVLTRVVLQRLEIRLHDHTQRAAGAHLVVRGAQLVPLIVLGTAIVLLIAAPTVRSYPGILSGRWFIPGVDWNFPGAGFRTIDSQRGHDRLETMARRIQEAVPAQEPVAILSEFDGILYVMAQRRPFSRFVPIYPAVALDSQAEEVVDALRNPRLRYLFWDRLPDSQPWGTYLPALLGPRVVADFERIDVVDKFEVWRRRPPAPPS